MSVFLSLATKSSSIKLIDMTTHANSSTARSSICHYVMIFNDDGRRTPSF